LHLSRPIFISFPQVLSDDIPPHPGGWLYCEFSLYAYFSLKHTIAN
jgi:hypothetical protein